MKIDSKHWTKPVTFRVGPGLTFTVTNTADSGAGSLRQAVIAANANAGADTIVFAAAFNSEAGDTIRLTGGEIAITDALTIDGGAGVTITGDAAGDDLTLAGGITDAVASRAAGVLDDNSRIFNSTAGSLSLNGLTLTGGAAPLNGAGGAILSSSTRPRTP